MIFNEQKIELNQNEMESKMKNTTHAFRMTNLLERHPEPF